MGVARVIDAVRARGQRAVRFNTDRFPTDARLVMQLGAQPDRGDIVRLVTEAGETVDFDEVTAIWYRRFDAGAGIPEELEPQIRHGAVLESRAAILGLLNLWPGFVMDRWDRVKHADHKPRQLRVAREVGLEIPPTLISNDPAAVRAFAEDCREGLVSKMMASFEVRVDGASQVVFTNPVDESALADLDGLRLCPMVFQARVPKALEIRATLVGGRILAGACDTAVSARAHTDWRRDAHDLAGTWKPYALPPSVESSLLRLGDRLGLHYGAADLLLTPDGRHVFLELNPVGEYYWLEMHAGLPLTEAIADVLVDGKRDGRSPGEPDGA